MEIKRDEYAGEIIIRKAGPADMEAVLELAGDVFEGEQGIPRSLNPIPPENTPQWWCAVTEGRIAGVAAAFVEDGRWHIGRLAVAKEMRGRHIATDLLRTAAAFVFDQGADIIYMEARDITVAIVKKMGGRVAGEPVPFYQGTVTPVVLETERFQ